MLEISRTYKKNGRFYVIVEIGDPIYGGSKLKKSSFKTQNERNSYVDDVEEHNEIEEMLNDHFNRS